MPSAAASAPGIVPSSSPMPSSPFADTAVPYHPVVSTTTTGGKGGGHHGHNHADQDERRLCGTCSRTSDNRHFDCPAKMADGRLFTDYRPRCAFVATQARGMAPVSNHAARQLMIRGADALIAKDRKEAKSRAACGPPCARDPGTVPPPEMLQKCDTRACAFLPARNPPPPHGHGPVYQSGLGRVYGSGNGSAGSVFAEADEEQRRMWGGDNEDSVDVSNCCIAPHEDPDFLPNSTYAPLGQGSDLGRLTVPFGGEAVRSVGGDPAVARYATGKAVDASPVPAS